MKHSQIWTKNFLIDAMINLLVYLVYFLMMIIIAGYAMDNLGASLSEGGLAVGIFIVGALIARIFGGKSIEQVGRKKMLYIGLTVYLLSTGLYFIIPNLAFLFLIRFLHGVGFGLASIATGTIVASLIPHERRGEGISYYALSTTLASAAGPFIGIYLSQHSSFSVVVSTCIALVAVSYVAAFCLEVPEANLTAAQLADMKQFKLSNFFEAKALPISAIAALLGLCYSGIASFIASYTKEIQLIEAGGFFFLVYSLAILISRPLTGRWLDTRGAGFVMYPSFILFSLGMAALGLARHGSVLLLAGGLIGFGFGTFLSCGQAIAIKLSPSHRMGLATSTFFAIADAGVGVGPFFLGLLVPSLGFRGLYLATAVAIVLSMGVYYLLCGQATKPAEKLVEDMSV